MIRAVLDTNILVSATLVSEGHPARIVDLWEKRRFVLLFSSLLLEEVQEALRYPRIRRRHGWSEEEIDAYVNRLTEMAILTTGQLRVSVVPQDPDDDVLVACAIEGEADFLVTGDQHLLSLGSYERIQIVTPARFWQHLSSESEAL